MTMRIRPGRSRFDQNGGIVSCHRDNAPVFEIDIVSCHRDSAPVVERVIVSSNRDSAPVVERSESHSELK